LHRAGELVAIRIPTVGEEAVRDLCRTRADMVEDRTRARHRLSKFLLRHGRVWRGGATAWTQAHERWLLAQQFDEPALRVTYAHYRAVLQARDAQLDAIETDLAGWYDRPPFAEQVARLSAYRGVTRLGALTLAAEVCDWRRFAHAPGVGIQIASRQQGLDPQVIARAWAAQLRLRGRFRRLAARKTSKNVVVAAIARELAGFLWAEMTA
jgi:transposase